MAYLGFMSKPCFDIVLLLLVAELVNVIGSQEDKDLTIYLSATVGSTSNFGDTNCHDKGEDGYGGLGYIGFLDLDLQYTGGDNGVKNETKEFEENGGESDDREIEE